MVAVAVMLVVVAGCGESVSTNAYTTYPPIDIPDGNPWVIIDTDVGRIDLPPAFVPRPMLVGA
jgi:hypothetical protein